MDGNKAISRLSSATKMLAECRTIDDAKHVLDVAEAARVYAQVNGLGQEAQNYAVEIKLRAQRRLGEFLSEWNIGPGRPPLNGHRPRTISLKDVGASKNQSSRWQSIATLPEDVFEDYIANGRNGSRELTASGALKLAKKLKANGTIDARPTPESGPAESFATVDELADAGRKFGCVYADPPWSYGNQGTRAATDNHYATMSLEDIAALRVEDVAADDAHLHLWTTNAFLFDAKSIMEAWGFTYKSCFVWVKPEMGMGNYWRVSHEFMLLGVRGKPDFGARNIKSWGEFKRGRHSAKPGEIRALIEQVSPGPYLEMFGRSTHSGWAVVGNQVERALF